MHLDLEVCRAILLKIEKEGGERGLTWVPKMEDYADDFVRYQQKKLEEAGYLKAKYYSGGSCRVDISYQGHGFLKQMLNDNIWNKTKEVAKKGGLELTLESVKQIIPFVYQSILNNLGH